MLNYNILSRLFVQNTVSRRLLQQASKVRKRKISPNEILWNILAEKNIRSVQDWKDIRNEALNHNRLITPANIDAITVGIYTSKKKYNLALSYLDFLKKENIDVNLATLGKYFKLLYERGVDEGLSQENEEKILIMYEDLRKSRPVLDSITLCNVAQAISLTKNWRLCFDLLDEIKIISSPCSDTYSAVAAASFLHNVDDLAWKLLLEMIEKNKHIRGVVYSSYFKKIPEDSTRSDGIEKMFKFMQENNVKIQSTDNDFIQSLLNLQLTVKPSTVNSRGVCRCCYKKLETFGLTDEEFDELKTTVAKNVIVGKDVFRKTTPEELAKFKEFVTKMPKFDVIIDGLNVAYIAGIRHSSEILSELLASTVSYFIRKKKKVLVLGRKHMQKWYAPNWNYIQQNATLFLTDNLSQDDPYLLYCALNSAKDTIIVTRDLMRSHIFLLKDNRLKFLFDRWFSQRQYLLLRIKRENCIFKKPLPFHHIAQKNEIFWHIPCVNESTETGTNWLCVKM